MKDVAALYAARRELVRSLGAWLRRSGRGALAIGRNSLAAVGLAVVAAAIFAVGRPDLRQQAELSALQWLQARELALVEAADDLLAVVGEPTALMRATATDPAELDEEQARVAHWIARRYRVAPEPISRLVQEAWAVGERTRLDPTLILAIMAVESSFNPFAQSPVGAQGLMQVMTRVHDDKYEPFGGTLAAFDPVTNLHVGVTVLRDCIRRFGGVEGGLRCYVGAALLEHDGGYAARVQFEQKHLQRVARGERVAFNARRTPPPAAPAPEKAAPAGTAQAAETAGTAEAAEAAETVALAE